MGGCVETMILVTGASGKSGQAVINALTRRGHGQKGMAVRGFIRNEQSITLIKQLGAASVMVGDLTLRDDLVTACQGVETIYHICPNMYPDEFRLGRQLISAAKEAGVRRIVYHSVLHPQTESMPHHWQKLRVEELLFKSGLAYTIVQPAAYMQNVLASRDAIQRQGVYAIPYAATTRLGMVDLHDVAEAVAWVLTEPGHDGATYELAGGEALDQAAVAAILADELARPVVAIPVDRREWATEARTNGLGPYAIDTLLKMFEYYEAYGFWGNPTLLTALLGRSPTTFRDFVRRELTA